MKNPNGYGTVVKLSGNRRNPFVARKTIGYTENGHPIQKAIGYYPTRKDAMMGLAEYNRTPFDIDLSKITFAEVYERWFKRDFEKLSKASARSHKASYNYCELLYNMPYKNIKSYHMQEIIDNCNKSYSTKNAIKNLFNALDNYALELEIIVRKNSELVKGETIPDTTREPFTKDEINILWDNLEIENVENILIFIYSGFRINELLNMKMEDINFEEMYFKGGSKTTSGKNRIVPIHPLIQKFILDRKDKMYKYVLSMNKIAINDYYVIWKKSMEKLGMNHTPHECRHTFRTLLDSADANKVCIDLMMGHKSKGTGERVYTHKTIEELRQSLALVTR